MVGKSCIRLGLETWAEQPTPFIKRQPLTFVFQETYQSHLTTNNYVCHSSKLLKQHFTASFCLLPNKPNPSAPCRTRLHNKSKRHYLDVSISGKYVYSTPHTLSMFVIGLTNPNHSGSPRALPTRRINVGSRSFFLNASKDMQFANEVTKDESCAAHSFIVPHRHFANERHNICRLAQGIIID